MGSGRGDPPYRIRTERLLIRCWDPCDAPLLKEAIDSSLDHLRPWSHWAHEEPQPLGEKVQLLRGFRGRFDLEEDFAFGIFVPDDSEVLGGTGLHTRGFPRPIGTSMTPQVVPAPRICGE